jgi:N-acetylmuramoyl-L-alanine amidase
MSYTLREYNNSRNFTPAAMVPAVYRQPRVVKAITIHHWGADGQNFDTVESFLCSNNKPTSAHYVAQDSLVSCIVSPDDAAWHAGHPVGNATTIGIECRPEATDGDYRTVGELIAFIRGIYGDLPLVPHNKWQNTQCPGRYDLARLDREARGVAAEPAPAPVAPQSAPAPAGTNYEADPHWVVEPGETLGQIAKHYGVTVTRIAKYNGLKNANKITVGEWIWPPVGRDTWTVDPGDTLSKIAAHYGISVDRICFANGINDPNSLAVGRRLQIPA